jgi:hypothetical protein
MYRVILGSEVSFARKVAKVISGDKCAPVTGPRLKIKSVTMRNCTTAAIPTGRMGPSEVAVDRLAVP